MLPRSLRYRAPLLWLVMPFVAGMVLARCGVFVPVVPSLALALGLCIWALCRVERVDYTWHFILCSSLALAGASAFHLHRNHLPEWKSLPPREARLVLRCDRIFASGDTSRCSGLATVQKAAPHLSDLLGQSIYFSLTTDLRQTRLLRSTILCAVGQLETVPLQPETRSFNQYLADAGVNFRLSRGQMIDCIQGPNAYYRFCDAALRKMGRVLGEGIDATRPSLAGVYRAMLLGQQNEMSEEQNQAFRQTGTMHLFAISGLHITVIAAALHGVLGLLHLPSIPKYALCIVLLWLYVDITGAAPSAIRAFIMVALVETSLLLRLPINPLATLCAATVVVMVCTPLQVFGASFQMSYGIVAVLILMAGPVCEEALERWLPFHDIPRLALAGHHQFIQTVWRGLTIALASGLCASLVGLITGVSFFGMLTPGSLAVNLVLIPISTYVLLSGLCSLFAGGLWLTGACILFNNAGALILLIMETTARLSASLPGMYYQRDFIWSWIGGASLLAILLFCIVGYSSRWTWKIGGYLPPVLLTALALLMTSRRP